MKRICLAVGIALLCGCGIRERVRPGPVDPPPPIRDLAPSSELRPVDSPPVPPTPIDPPPPRVEPAPIAAPRPTVEEAIGNVNGQLEDVYFAYDQFDLSPDAVAALRHDAELLRVILRDFPQVRIAVEGHCDERGSAEYNLGLGDRRASRTVASLSQFGLPQASFAPVSFGKEAPQCSESMESCWRRNRRAHFVVRLSATN